MQREAAKKTKKAGIDHRSKKINHAFIQLVSRD